MTTCHEGEGILVRWCETHRAPMYDDSPTCSASNVSEGLTDGEWNAVRMEADPVAALASNVSEGLREAVERYIVAMTRRASGGTTDAEVQAAYAALYDAAAAPDASNVSEGLPTAGFAADRPTGPRTMKGHALASSLRRRLRKGAIDYDAWIRDIEAEAAALAHAAPEGLDVLDRADNLARFAGRYLAGDSDIQPEDVRAAIDDYWLHRQPDATEEAGRDADWRPVDPAEREHWQSEPRDA